MKKIFIALVLIFCMALPAFAKEVPVTTSKELLDAAASSDVDKIVITAQTVTLQASTRSDIAYCGLSIDRQLTLQINDGCTLHIVGASNDLGVIGICSPQPLTITGKGAISVKTLGANRDAFGIYVGGSEAKLNIAGGVTLSASGAGSGKSNCAISAVSGSQVNIFDAAVSGDLCESGGTIKVYGGTFKTYNPTSHLGAGCTVGTTAPYTVSSNVTETFDPETLSFDVTSEDQSGVVTVKLTSSDTNIEKSFDEIVVISNNEIAGLSCDVSKSDGTITFKATKDCVASDAHKFTIAACAHSGDNYLGQTKTFNVKVTKTIAKKPMGPQPAILPDDVRLPEETTQGEAHIYETKAEAITALGGAFSDDQLDIYASEYVTSLDGRVIVDESEYVIVSPTTAAQAINNSFAGISITSKDILSFPIVNVNAGSDKEGYVILATFAVSGDMLGYEGQSPSKIRMYKLLSGTSAKKIEYTEKPEDAQDTYFTVLDEDCNPAEKIESDKMYFISVYVKDKGDFDLDKAKDGKILDPIAIDTSGTTPSSGGSSSGGCNAGFGALALATLAVIAAAKRRNK